jgi:O-antigen/teichoic acid export membrane protein
MALIYGSDFIEGGSALATLMFSAACMVVASVQAGMLTASDRPRWTVGITVPALVVAMAAFPLLIPGRGMVGAATATLLGAATGLCTGVVLIRLAWRVMPPPLTVLRVALVSVGSWWAAASWSTPGAMVVLKMALLVPAVFVSLIILGELDRSELKELRALVSSKPKERDADLQ